MNLKTIEKALIDASIDDAKYEALLLAEEFSGLSKAHLMANKDEEIKSSELENAVNRRINHEPLQYILGKWEFMGLPFIVNENCLIPRADTETITTLAIDKMKNGGAFADLCTGSGCIAISVLVNTQGTKCTAVELVRETADVAIANATLNQVNNRFDIIVADINDDPLEGEYDLITANPPYITLEEMNQLSKEVMFEPRVALTDEGDGLSLIRVVMETGIKHIKENGEILIEIGYLQGESVKNIALELGLKCEIIKDLENRDRVAKISKG